MPNGVYPVPKFRFQHDRRTAPRRGLRPSVEARLQVWLHRDRLDHELGAGVDPAGSGSLELRAAQLLHGRLRLADSIDRVLARAHTPAPPFTAEVPPRRAETRACSDDLRALARRLRDGQPIDVQGAALTARLLADGASPLYVASDRSLRYTVRCARLALDPLGSATEDLSIAA